MLPVAMSVPIPLLLAACTLVLGCNLQPRTDGPRQDPGDDPADASVELVRAFPNVSFTRPVDLQHAGDGSGRLFVVEQAGRIRVVPSADAEEAPVFLDIRSRVNDRGNEQGLLGLAFHPDYETNGLFYVDYTAADPNRTVVARYRVDPDDPNRADPVSETVLLEVPQPYGNHNGGQIAFGPDGRLYIALGDGGAGGDPQDHGQDTSTLLGTILRIDVDAPSGGRAYGIPPDNPFADGADGRPEIYAYGLRNPWRFSFDRLDGRLWTADVGQNSWEEIDVVVRGGNYGWNTMEGEHCFEPRSGCDEAGLKMPIHEYGRSDGGSVTGGFVYRGDDVPSLRGRYVYADFVSGRIWALRFDGDALVSNDLLMDTDLNVASFGTDADDELYLTAFDGNVYRFVSD